MRLAAPPLIEPDVRLFRIRLSCSLSPLAFTGELTPFGFLFGLLAQLLSQLKEGRRQPQTLPGFRPFAHPLRLFRSGIVVATQSALPSSDSARSALGPLGSTIITRFPATTGPSDSRAQSRPVMDFRAKLAPTPCLQARVSQVPG